MLLFLLPAPADRNTQSLFPGQKASVDLHGHHNNTFIMSSIILGVNWQGISNERKNPKN